MKSPEPALAPQTIVVGRWTAHRPTGELLSGGETRILEPKVRDLLFLLAARRGEVVSRDEITAALWPRVIVGEDSLARCVFKLRKALDDDARAPRHVETLSKRGYRLAREPEPVLEAAPGLRSRWRGVAAASGIAAAIVVMLISVAGIRVRSDRDQSLARLNRADDFYHQMHQAQNEAAIELYARLASEGVQMVGAYAGLANALSQRAIRWPQGVRTVRAYKTLADALRAGELRHGYAADQLRRARSFAEQAIALAPRDARGYKALGLVLSASGDLEGALANYRRAIALDPDAWEPFIDAADVLEISGRAREAVPLLEAAYDIMSRRLATDGVRIMPWYAATAVLIGDRHEKLGEMAVATHWFRRAVEYAPLESNATERLAARLAWDGDPVAAQSLCRQLQLRIPAGTASEKPICSRILLGDS